ncbi:MAG: hypothetical protein QXZ02_03040 [Candidatus Bathyarchaeia archaeon]
MSQKSCMLWTKVDAHIRKLVEALARSQGLTISEYVRRLVIEDLDKRSVFTAKLKEVARNHDK